MRTLQKINVLILIIMFIFCGVLTTVRWGYSSSNTKHKLRHARQVQINKLITIIYDVMIIRKNLIKSLWGSRVQIARRGCGLWMAHFWGAFYFKDLLFSTKNIKKEAFNAWQTLIGENRDPNPGVRPPSSPGAPPRDGEWGRRLSIQNPGGRKIFIKYDHKQTFYLFKNLRNF